MENTEYLEQLQRCMKVIVEMDRRIATTPIIPQVSTPSRNHKVCFQRRVILRPHNGHYRGGTIYF